MFTLHQQQQKKSIFCLLFQNFPFFRKVFFSVCNFFFVLWFSFFFFFCRFIIALLLLLVSSSRLKRLKFHFLFVISCVVRYSSPQNIVLIFGWLSICGLIWCFMQSIFGIVSRLYITLHAKSIISHNKNPHQENGMHGNFLWLVLLVDRRWSFPGITSFLGQK